ncbi:MAG: hypothetical protein M5T61_16030 [Acidimicrobiia bacterium]|nr:hypothetical protein [Acidimicrobiia bacterium]
MSWIRRAREGPVDAIGGERGGHRLADRVEAVDGIDYAGGTQTIEVGDAGVEADGVHERVSEVLVGGQLHGGCSQERVDALGVAGHRDGPVGLEVDHELAAVALADGDERGDGGGELVGRNGGVRVVGESPRPPAVGRGPRRDGIGLRCVPEQLDARGVTQLDGDRRARDVAAVEVGDETGEVLAGPADEGHIGGGDDGIDDLLAPGPQRVVAGSSDGATAAQERDARRQPRGQYQGTRDASQCGCRGVSACGAAVLPSGAPSVHGAFGSGGGGRCWRRGRCRGGRRS